MDRITFNSVEEYINQAKKRAMAQDYPEQELLKSVFVIEKHETVASGGKPKIKIVGDNKKTYGFFKYLKDTEPPEDTKAFAYFKEQNLDVGSKVAIGYVDRKGEHPQHGKYTSHDIRFFDDPDDIQYSPQNLKQQGTKSSAEPTYHKEHQGDEEFWQKKAFGQCRHAYLLIAFEKGEEMNPGLVQKANKWAYASMFGVLPGEGTEWEDVKPYNYKPPQADNNEPPPPEEDGG